MNILKNNIQAHRKRKGLSQEELAQQCKVSRQTINAIENDKYDPSLQLAFTLSRVLNLTIEELFLFNDEGEVTK